MRLFLCYLLALFALPPPPALVALPPPVVLPCATACCVKLIAKKEAISAAEITTPHTAIVINFVFSSISIQNIITEYYCCCIIRQLQMEKVQMILSQENYSRLESLNLRPL